MACGTFTTAPSNSTAVLFKAWVAGLKAAILACGWVQTNDTGQLVVDNLTVPTATNTSSGYMVFAMADNLQATYPVYMRIDVGSGSATATPLVWVQVGTATNGAGVLSGITTTQRSLPLYGNSTTQMASFYSGSTSRFVVCLWIGTGTNNSAGYYGSIISVERSHDNTGADTSDGALVLTSDAPGLGGRIYSHYLAFAATTQPVAYRHWNATMPPTGSGSANNNSYLYLVRGWGFGETSPSLNLFMYFTTDLTSQNSVTAALWDGNSHVVLPLGYEQNTTYYTYGAAEVTPCVAMRYD